MSEICSKDKLSTGFSGLTMTTMASRAITNSTGLEPFWMAESFSSSFIRREALAISTVPFINAAMPVPDPPPVTERMTSGLTTWYSSAQARAKLTMVSEPLFSINDTGADELSGEVVGSEQLVKESRINATNNGNDLEILIGKNYMLNNTKEQALDP